MTTEAGEINIEVNQKLKLQNPVGTRDLFLQDATNFEDISGILREIAKRYGFCEIITPTFQHLDTYLVVDRAINRKLFIFEDKSGRKLVLRPEMNAPISRVMATKLCEHPKPIRLFYLVPVFRYENPQKGSYREFWQFGLEIFGTDSINADFEVIDAAVDAIRGIGFDEFTVRVNNLGLVYELLALLKIPKCNLNAVAYKIRFASSEEDVAKTLKENCVDDKGVDAFIRFRRLSGPFLSVKNELEHILGELGEAPRQLRDLSDMVSMCIASGIKGDSIVFKPTMMRGTAHYTGNVFEIYLPGFDADVCGGGRYDDMVGLYGAEKVPAVGCAFGVDRLVMLAKEKGLIKEKRSDTKVLAVPIPQANYLRTLEAVRELRKNGINTELEPFDRKLGKSLDYANKKGIPFILICGNENIKSGRFTLKEMASGEQKEMTVDELIAFLKAH